MAATRRGGNNAAHATRIRAAEERRAQNVPDTNPGVEPPPPAQGGNLREQKRAEKLALQEAAGKEPTLSPEGAAAMEERGQDPDRVEERSQPDEDQVSEAEQLIARAKELGVENPEDLGMDGLRAAISEKERATGQASAAEGEDQ
jgi:hypothetical protein